MPVKVSKAMRNNELRGPTAIDTDIIPSDSEHVFAQEALYQEAMMRYHCAILEMRTKLEVLSKDMTKPDRVYRKQAEKAVLHRAKAQEDGA